MTQVIESIDRYRSLKASETFDSLGFVPTLGALHEGHISLIERSLQENQKTVVSVFLNPTQFNDVNDLKNYPKTWEKDQKILNDLNVDFIFKPNQNEIYPDDYTFKIKETKFSKILCGAKRPGHFDGVLSVVMKLLNITSPSKAYFGEKDYQQFLLIKNMTKAYFLRTEIVPCPIVRENNGLALSSRNLLLTEAGRSKAPLLYKTINESESIEAASKTLSKLGFKVDYLEEHWGRRFVAAFLEDVRLIDNVKI